MAIAVLADERELSRIAENVDGHHHARARRAGAVELRHIHVQRVEPDVDKFQLQPVLLKRMKRRRPGNGGHDHLVASLQRTCGAVEQRGDCDKIGRRT